MIKLGVLRSFAGWLGLALVAGLVLPMVVGVFWVHVLIEILIMGLFATSFNLLFGYMGQLSFGQAAYYGIGAYTTALMISKASLPLPLCMVASMLLAGIFALIFGFFCVRLTGIYFAILTMAFGQLVFYVIFQWYSFTGGDNGIQGIPVPPLLQDAQVYYYFTLALVIAALIAMRLITQSPFGYTLRAIRDNSDRTRFIGINIRRYMLINFVISGMFAGLAGSLWAPFNRSIAPDLANWAHSGIPVFMAVIGGPLGFFGPLVGSLVYTFLSAFVTGFTEYWPIVIGIIIILIVLFLPGGILGTLQKIQPEETNHAHKNPETS